MTASGGPEPVGVEPNGAIDSSEIRRTPPFGQWSRQGVGRFLLHHTLLGMLMLIAVAFSVVNRNFATIGNMVTILLAVAPLALLCFGQTYVILTAGIDLSIGSIAGLAGVVTVVLLEHHIGFPAALAGGVLAGGAVGLVNGFLVAYARVAPFVATLGTLAAVLSVAYVLSNGEPLGNTNSWFQGLSSGSAVGVPILIWIVLGLFLGLWFVLGKTTYGTRVYAVGGNPVAARLAGIKVERVTLSVYVISGLLAGLAGVMLASTVTAGIATTGDGYELNAIAGAVIGGVSLFGGRGTLWGAAIGITMLTMLTNGLNVLNVSQFYQGLVEGTLIVFAVFMDGLYIRVFGES